MTNPAQIIRRLNEKMAKRAEHEWIWRECYDHTFPIRGEGIQSQNSNAQAALDRKARLVDNTATDSCRILASSLQLGMTPASARWMELAVFGADDEGRRWLDEVADQLHQEIHNSNFDSEAPDAMVDLVTAGWFALMVDINQDVGGGLAFQAWPLGQCYVSSTRSDGYINGIHRKYSLSAAALAEFAEKRGGSVSSQLMARMKVDPDCRADIVHAIEPRMLYETDARMGKNMPFSSCFVELDTQHLIHESGYMEFPVIVPRWARIPGSDYAVGPMYDALPEARELNELKRMDKAAADIAVGGMWLGVDDGILNPRTIKVGARRVIPAASIDSLKELRSGSDWQLADVRIAQMQMSIRKLLLAEQLQPQDGPQMTATEIHARVALIRQQLGPLFGRMQAEYLQALVTRCFMLGMRAGLFRDPPGSLGGRNYVVRYISPLARSQRLEDVTAIQSTVSDVLQMANIAPSVVDNYDWDAMQRVLGEARGLPMKLINDMKKIQAIREARAKQQQEAAQQAQEQEMQMQMAKAGGAQQAAA